MPSRTPQAPLRDMQRNITLAREFVSGLSFDEFCADRRTVYAVTRCLEIVSEASRKLPADFKARYPDIPWPDVAGAGNVFRHDYEDVLDRIVWQTVQHSLQALADMAAAGLERFSDP